MKYLILDMSNLLWRAYHANIKESKGVDDEDFYNLGIHVGLQTMHTVYKKFSPCKAVLAFDRPNWRKAYTQDEQLAVTSKVYKGHRRENLTESEKKRFERFLEYIRELEQFFRDQTATIVMSRELLEADDLIAGFVQYHPDDEHIIVSSDKDFIQILRHDNCQLYDPIGEKYRSLDDWDGDADLFMFEKCLRGDIGDNVQSAYPRVRKTKIRKAFEDPYERTNMMHHKWTDQNGKEYNVGDLFKENELLMDLEKQPEEIRDLIMETVVDAKSCGHFKFFNFVKFLGEHNLKKISESAETYVDMLS